MTAIDLMNDIKKDISSSTFNDISGLLGFENAIWFWLLIRDYGLLKYIENSQEDIIVETAQSLLYAYKYSGTMEGIIRLCQGIFGKQSIVIVDDSAPAVIDIEVKNANPNFIYSLCESADFAIAKDTEFAFAINDASSGIGYDPFSFFRHFLTPGRVINQIKISGD